MPFGNCPPENLVVAVAYKTCSIFTPTHTQKKLQLQSTTTALPVTCNAIQTTKWARLPIINYTSMILVHSLSSLTQNAIRMALYAARIHSAAVTTVLYRGGPANDADEHPACMLLKQN